jgi:ABC-2 type transport system permease protein
VFNPAHTPFGAIFHAEILLNRRRVAPYVMIALFAGNAWLWTAKGAAVHHDWAVNSDYFIVRNLLGFSFLTLPLFTALIMADAVARDFRTGVYPLIFSKPVRRGTYLAAKFCGNFCVLVVCQAAFVVTMMVLQAFPTTEMLAQPFRVFPFIKHLLFFVVITHLLLASISFTVGTLTRNTKIVYGIVVMLYPLYIFFQVQILKGTSATWRQALDPLLMNWAGDQALAADGGYISASLINALTMNYDLVVVANRIIVVIASLLCLSILWLRFSMTDRVAARDKSALTTINLGTSADWLVPAQDLDEAETLPALTRKTVEIPTVGLITTGMFASVKQWLAALAIELRLLKVERGLIVILPLAMVLCVATLAGFPPEERSLHAGAYAARTAELLILFLATIAIVFMVEAIHRDRELRFEPILWSVPAPNSVFLLSKFAATFVLSISVSVLVGLAAVILQLSRGRIPLDLLVYLKVYLLILMPTIIVLVSAVMMLNVVLRDKYVAYAVSFALAIALFYFLNHGHNHWSYNLVMYEIWTPSDLSGAGLKRILAQRIYALFVSGMCLVVAHLFFQRKTNSKHSAR